MPGLWGTLSYNVSFTAGFEVNADGLFIVLGAGGGFGGRLDASLSSTHESIDDFEVDLVGSLSAEAFGFGIGA